MPQIIDPRSSAQTEKEALDDLFMELELADEDEPVMYVRRILPHVSAHAWCYPLGTKLGKHSSTYHMAAL